MHRIHASSVPEQRQQRATQRPETQRRPQRPPALRDFIALSSYRRASGSSANATTSYSRTQQVQVPNTGIALAPSDATMNEDSPTGFECADRSDVRDPTGNYAATVKCPVNGPDAREPQQPQDGSGTQTAMAGGRWKCSSGWSPSGSVCRRASLKKSTSPVNPEQPSGGFISRTCSDGRSFKIRTNWLLRRAGRLGH